MPLNRSAVLTRFAVSISQVLWYGLCYGGFGCTSMGGIGAELNHGTDPSGNPWTVESHASDKLNLVALALSNIYRVLFSISAMAALIGIPKQRAVTLREHTSGN